MCLSCALSGLCALFCVGSRCSDPGTNVLIFGFVFWGSDTHAPCSVSFYEHAVSSSLGYVLFCPRVAFFVVSRSLCFYRLRVLMLSRLV